MMQKIKSGALPERPKFEVELTIHTVPRTIKSVRHGDSAEHAIEKAKQTLGPGYVVIGATARQIGGPPPKDLTKGTVE